jgi:hypothetical protein
VDQKTTKIGTTSSKWVSRHDGQSGSFISKMSLKGGGFVIPDFKQHCEIVNSQQPIEEGATTNKIKQLKLSMYLQNPTPNIEYLLRHFIFEETVIWLSWCKFTRFQL